MLKRLWKSIIVGVGLPAIAWFGYVIFMTSVNPDPTFLVEVYTILIILSILLPFLFYFFVFRE